jgi:hypothetical protein
MRKSRSEANQKAIDAAELTFILGMKFPDVLYQVEKWRREYPGEEIPDGTSSPTPGPPARKTSGATRSSTTDTRQTGHEGCCAGSTNSHLGALIQDHDRRDYGPLLEQHASE